MWRSITTVLPMGLATLGGVYAAPAGSPPSGTILPPVDTFQIAPRNLPVYDCPASITSAAAELKATDGAVTAMCTHNPDSPWWKTSSTSTTKPAAPVTTVFVTPTQPEPKTVTVPQTVVVTPSTSYSYSTYPVTDSTPTATSTYMLEGTVNGTKTTTPAFESTLYKTNVHTNTDTATFRCVTNSCSLLPKATTTNPLGTGAALMNKPSAKIVYGIPGSAIALLTPEIRDYALGGASSVGMGVSRFLRKASKMR